MSYHKLDEIENSLTDNSRTYTFAEGCTNIAISSEYDVVTKMRTIDRVTEKIIKGSTTLYRVEKDKVYQRFHIKADQLGSELLRLLKSDLRNISRHFSNHYFNPRITLFINSVIARELFIYDDTPNNEQDAIHLQDACNGLVAHIRKVGKSQRFKTAIESFNRGPNKLTVNLRKYFENIYEKIPDLIFARFDLAYVKPATWPDEKPAIESIKIAKQHWSELLKFMNKKLFKKYLEGYVCKMTTSLDSGPQLNVIVLLNPLIAAENIDVVKVIGSHWHEAITKKRGLWFNSIFLPRGPKSSRIIYSIDKEVSSCSINKVVSSITHADKVFKLKLPRNGRKVFRGGPKEAQHFQKTHNKVFRGLKKKQLILNSSSESVNGMTV